MGQICCTKYGEDGQSALILDKEKQTPQKRAKTNKKEKKMMNRTSDIYDEDDKLEFDENFKGKSRNQLLTDRSTDTGHNNVPQNTIMNWNDSHRSYKMGGSEMGFGSQMDASSSVDFSAQSVQTLRKNGAPRFYAQKPNMNQENTYEDDRVNTEPSGDIDTSKHPYPEYRLALNKRLRQKLKAGGHPEFSTSSDKKQLIIDPEFYKEFMIKMKCLREIQEEDDRKTSK